jgi:hypothetical protein
MALVVRGLARLGLATQLAHSTKTTRARNAPMQHDYKVGKCSSRTHPFSRQDMRGNKRPRGFLGGKKGVHIL